MHRLSTTVATALSTLLFVSICSAQNNNSAKTPGGSYEYIVDTCSTAVVGFIPFYTSTGAYNWKVCNSSMHQSADLSVTVNQNFNVNYSPANPNPAYLINGFNGLRYFNGNVLVGPACPVLTSGGGNICVGNAAGLRDTTGSFNVYLGNGAGVSNNTGNYNTFSGLSAGYSNIAGSDNTFSGMNSGFYNNGSYNTFIGAYAGVNNTTGSSNIYIGNPGCPNWLCNGNNTIRIGTNGVGNYQQNQVYIEPILANITGLGDDVTISPTGQLGHVGSSRRFKENILDMGDSSNKLFQLRPVTFFYKPQYDNGSQLLQYGLIAEEVANVYPEMVIYDKRRSALGG